MRIERSAGGIVFRRGTNGPEILLIKDSHSNWAFPKGRIEPGEKAGEAALRETTEEVGLRELKLVKSLGEVQFWYHDKWEVPGDTVKKFIEHFLIEASGKEKPMPQEEEGIHEVRWVRPNELKDLISYKTLKPIVKKISSEVSRIND